MERKIYNLLESSFPNVSNSTDGVQVISAVWWQFSLSITSIGTAFSIHFALFTLHSKISLRLSSLKLNLWCNWDERKLSDLSGAKLAIKILR